MSPAARHHPPRSAASHLTALHGLCWVGRRDGGVELRLWLTQKRDGVSVRLVALLHLPVCLHSLVQDGPEAGSLCGGRKRHLSAALT